MKRGGLLSQDLEKRLTQQSLGSVPLVDPDQQHRFLGTFKERCVALLYVSSLSDEKLLADFSKIAKEYKEGTILINGAISESLLGKLLGLFTQENLNFTVINDHVSGDPKEIGLLLTLNTVSNVSEDDLDLAKKASKPSQLKNPQPTEKRKKGFFSKLFS